MTAAWRWKLILALGTLLLSVYLVVPTVTGWTDLQEKAAAQGTSLPWYVSLFPAKGIHFGLDLKGGIYVELEVAKEEAVWNRADLMATELAREVKDAGLTDVTVEHPPKSSQFIFTYKEAAQKTKIEDDVLQSYRRVLVTEAADETNQKWVMTLSTEYQDRLKDEAVRQALETIRNRIDRYGVTEPSIARLGSDRIAVELPGVEDPERALKLVKTAGKLEFKLVDETKTSTDLNQLIDAARKEGGIPEGYAQDAVAKLNEALTGKLPTASEIAFEIHRDPITKKTTGGTPYLLKSKAELTGNMLRDASVNIYRNEPYVALTFAPEGARLFGDLTKANVGQRLAILLDGNVSSAPEIKEPILTGEARITFGLGSYANLQREAEDLVLVLKEGALPTSLHEVTKTVVGPSLGKDLIKKGVTACLYGSLAVIVFMILYAKLSGLLADLALVCNLILMLGMLVIFSATLTLPGIAGIVLTIGMAVDANVLIIERIKEELRAGRPIRAAVEQGYSNAVRTILDSNLTTVIAALVLYQYGTGPIRGFGVTLIMGLAANLFTSIIITRLVYDYFVVRRHIQRLSL